MNKRSQRLAAARTVALVASLLGGILLLDSCGQKGDLYLPDKPPTKVVPAATPAAAASAGASPSAPEKTDDKNKKRE